MMTPDFLILAIIGVTVVFLFIFIFIRDFNISKKIKIYENSLETLNKTIFEIEKQMKRMDQLDDLEQCVTKEEVKQILNNEIGNFTKSLIKGLRDIQDNNLQFQDNIQNRVEKLENKMKDFMIVPTNPLMDEDKVIKLFKSGYTIESIAKDLRMTVGEVDFVLKLNNLK